MIRTVTHFRYIIICIMFMICTFPARAMTPGIEQHVAGLVDKLKSAVVSCEMRVEVSAYEGTGRYQATGLVIDRRKGLILTNRHVASSIEIAQYYVTFINGRQVKAKFVYNDPTHDFAFLMVDPIELPEDVPELILYDKDFDLNETVLMLGNNAGRGFSMQYGIVSDKYAAKGRISTQVYVISLNAAGGSSGSGVFDMEGRVRALLFAGPEQPTHAFTIPIKYILDALEYLDQAEMPPRHEPGLVLKYYPMDKVVRFDHMDPSVSREYAKKYPDCFNKGIMISGIMPGSDASGKLLSGDIIHSINGKEVGPSIYDVQKIQNEFPVGKPCMYTVYRGGKLIDVPVELYDAQDYVIKRMVKFGGAFFYEADEMMGMIAGVTKGDCAGEFNTRFFPI